MRFVPHVGGFRSKVSHPLHVTGSSWPAIYVERANAAGVTLKCGEPTHQTAVEIEQDGRLLKAERRRSLPVRDSGCTKFERLGIAKHYIDGIEECRQFVLPSKLLDEGDVRETAIVEAKAVWGWLQAGVEAREAGSYGRRQ